MSKKARSDSIVPVAPDKLARVSPEASLEDARKPQIHEEGMEIRPQFFTPASIVLGLLALNDHVFAYLSWIRIAGFREREYNVAEVQLLLLFPGTDSALLFFALLGTLIFVALFVLQECLKKPEYFRRLLTFRIYGSAVPCAVLSSLILYASARTNTTAVLAVLANLVSTAAWTFDIRKRIDVLEVFKRTSLDLTWFFSLLAAVMIVYAYFTNRLPLPQNCEHTHNVALPVYFPILNQWFCVKWNEQTIIDRLPVEAEPVAVACGDTYVGRFGLSLDPHRISCPIGCLQMVKGEDAPIVGCGIYATDSPLCLSAIHSGALTVDGGTTVVYGRLGIPVFNSCNRNSIVSQSRKVDVEDLEAYAPQESLEGSGGLPRALTSSPLVLNEEGRRTPQAYFFRTESNVEYLTIVGPEVLGQRAIGEEEPFWHRIKGKVTMSVAGLVLNEEGVSLGDPGFTQLSFEKRPGQVFVDPPKSCSVTPLGVECQGMGNAAAQFDFCREHRCPSQEPTLVDVFYGEDGGDGR